MCGISCSISKSRSCVQDVINNLKQIQNRGYDSYGIFNGTQIYKDIGNKIEDQNGCSLTDSKICISHTRWATHGGVCYKNTHPIIEHGIGIVHNGVVDNVHNIIKEYSVQNEQSETDTEIILKLYIQFYNHTQDQEQSIKLTRNILAGSNSFVIIHLDKLYYSTVNMPLIIFRSEDTDNVYVTSEPVYWQMDGYYKREINSYGVVSFENIKGVFYKANPLQNNFISNHMLSEIYQVNDIIKTKPTKHINLDTDVILYACGSSYHACLLYKNYVEIYSSFNIKVVDACIYVNEIKQINKEALHVFVSQSGETRDILDIIDKLGNVKKLGIVNNDNSTLTQLCDNIINMDTGKEMAVASTKSYIASFINLLYTSNFPLQEITIDTGRLKIEYIKNLASSIHKYTSIFICGWDSVTHNIAMEVALKLKEISYIHAEAITLKGLKHGPFALLDNNCGVIVIEPFENDIRVDSILSQIACRIDKKNISLLSTCFNKPDNYLDYILNSCITGQLLAYYTAVKLNIDPCFPRNIAKVITV